MALFKKTLIALALVVSASVSAQQTAQSCQFHLSRHSSISCQFSNHPVPQPQVVIVNPPAWTQATVFTNPPPVIIYQEPQVVYVQPMPPVFIAPGMHIPDLPYQPNPYMPYYNPNPYPRHRHR